MASSDEDQFPYTRFDLPDERRQTFSKASKMELIRRSYDMEMNLRSTRDENLKLAARIVSLENRLAKEQARRLVTSPAPSVLSPAPVSSTRGKRKLLSANSDIFKTSVQRANDASERLPCFKCSKSLFWDKSSKSYPRVLDRIAKAPDQTVNSGSLSCRYDSCIKCDGCKADKKPCCPVPKLAEAKVKELMQHIHAYQGFNESDQEELKEELLDLQRSTVVALDAATVSSRPAQEVEQ